MTMIGGSSLNSQASPNNSTFSKTSSWSQVGHRVSASTWESKKKGFDEDDSMMPLDASRLRRCGSPPWPGSGSRRRLSRTDRTARCCRRRTGCELGTCGPSAGRSASLWTDEDAFKKTVQINLKVRWIMYSNYSFMKVFISIKALTHYLSYSLVSLIVIKTDADRMMEKGQSLPQ